ncbi:hypothetical protein I7I50_02341 [Histoplasma capsulatum G186AR]|uniref:Uncharacterized protein n=1 Tax=Ajellomyces capsulatus TaxID=5037 RepID=A0A8H8D656_AJECA|nr:hypothetical protein I7I52_00995 [Histoplasma capsulatum]QSS71492.1 hypothetical protein I7I50_02341 [Histoplasma capsulatum G186AR]
MTAKFNPNYSLIPDVSSFYTTRGHQVPVNQPACGVFRSVIHVHSLTRVYRVHILKGLAFFALCMFIIVLPTRVEHPHPTPYHSYHQPLILIYPYSFGYGYTLLAVVYALECFLFNQVAWHLFAPFSVFFVQEVTRADSTTAQHFKRRCSLILLIVLRCVFYYLQNIGRSVPGGGGYSPFSVALAPVVQQEWGATLRNQICVYVHKFSTFSTS